MDRRSFLARTGAGVVGASLMGGSVGAATELSNGSPGISRPARPNLIFIFADQLRPMSLGFSGDAVTSTPRIDKLAAEGANFVNCVSNTAVCAPYRATMLTGRYGHTHGVITNKVRLPEEEITFGEIFSAAGYRTGWIGKWHLTGTHERQYEPPGAGRHGFDYWRAFNFNHRHNHCVYYGDGPDPLEPEGYQMDWETDRAVDFIRDAAGADDPFCLFVSWGPPHPPYEVWNMPPRYLERYGEVEEVALNELPEEDRPHWQPWQQPVRFTPEASPLRGNVPAEGALGDLAVATYHAMIDWCDDCLGRVLDALDEAGLAGDTVVVFSSDHGEMLNSHGTRGKMIYYDESVRIPFLVRWRGVIPENTVSDACIANVDFLPTLLGLVGLEHPNPASLEGMDLSHCARGEPGPEPEGAILVSYSGYGGFKRGWEYRGVRTKRWTYVRSLGELRRWYGGWEEDDDFARTAEIHLHDNLNDPLQTRDLAEDPAYADVRARCEAIVQRYMERTGDEFLPGPRYREWYDENWRLIR